MKGLCADLKIQITEKDIAQVRREMWGNFPREIISFSLSVRRIWIRNVRKKQFVS
ncbi:MAG: hypothetical protein ACRC1Z_08965 [Waterburya sp.]